VTSLGLGVAMLLLRVKGLVVTSLPLIRRR
jgi:hypothetical protein